MPESMPLGMIGGFIRSSDLKGMGVWGKGVAETFPYGPDLMAHLVFGGSRGVKVVSFFRFFFQHVFSDVFGVILDPKLAPKRAKSEPK